MEVVEAFAFEAVGLVLALAFTPVGLTLQFLSSNVCGANVGAEEVESGDLKAVAPILTLALPPPHLTNFYSFRRVGFSPSAFSSHFALLRLA